jgi:hypothetical protein
MLSAFTRGTVLLPSDNVLPIADASTECFEENFLLNGALLPISAHMLVSSLYQFFVFSRCQQRPRADRISTLMASTTQDKCKLGRICWPELCLVFALIRTPGRIDTLELHLPNRDSNRHP